MVPLILSIGITPTLTNVFAAVDSNQVEIQKQDLRYKVDPLTQAELEECESRITDPAHFARSIYSDYLTMPEEDFYLRYLYHTFAGNCVMLYEDPVWDEEGDDRYEKLSARLAELIEERRSIEEKRKSVFTVTPKSVIEGRLPGTYIFTFEACTGENMSLKIKDVLIASDVEVVQAIPTYAEQERDIPSNVCRILEFQVKADDPATIRIMLPMAEIPVRPENLEDKPPASMKAPTEVSILSKILIVRGDLSHKAEPLNDKDLKECENINQDFQKFDETNFNTRYLYHEFVGDCILLYEDPIWETRDSSNIDEINQRLDELKKQKEISRKGEEFKPFSITPLSIEEISDDLHIYSFEGCTRDEFVNVENAVAASDTEVLSLVNPKREGNILPPGICRVFDIKIRAEDPSSIKVVLPMMGIENMSDKQDESQIIYKSPRAQVRSGIASTEVVCKEGFELLLKTNDGSPACVKESTAGKLIERGWGKLA